MNKIIKILVLSFLFSNNVLAKDYRNSFTFFNWWLQDNGFNKYLEKDSNGQLKNNLDIKAHKNRWGILYKSNPNRDTLIYYLYKYQHSHLVGDPSTKQWETVEVKPSKKPYEFKFNLIEDKFVKKEMQTKGILSYLYFQDGQVLIDEISPKNRLGEFLDNESKFMSMSMNKSVTSYILGHAICDGYIGGLDDRINDWPLLSNTLYENQKLIDFLNMSVGDQKYINEFKNGTTGHPLADLNYEYETNTIYSTLGLFFKNTAKSKNYYNYNGFIAQLLFNYVKHNTGEDFQKILNKVFQDKVKTKNSVHFGKIRNTSDDHGNGHPMVRMTRFDYLRLAKAIMDDYQNDTCVGKYLKEIHKRRIPKKLNKNENEPEFNQTKSYGGQFHMDYPGLKDKIVFGMGGYGGQAILIDMENSRIVVLNSLHYNNGKYKYNVKKLLLNPIKKGK
ncbi:hypothetical protein N8886_00775 [Candidatus Pelagibacter ubique]|nr:hypothetical protein [Candidatus Pelagibacter ubique]